MRCIKVFNGIKAIKILSCSGMTITNYDINDYKTEL